MRYLLINEIECLLGLVHRALFYLPVIKRNYTFFIALSMWKMIIKPLKCTMQSVEFRRKMFCVYRKSIPSYKHFWYNKYWNNMRAKSKALLFATISSLVTFQFLKVPCILFSDIFVRSFVVGFHTNTLQHQNF